MYEPNLMPPNAVAQGMDPMLMNRNGMQYPHMMRRYTFRVTARQIFSCILLFLYIVLESLVVASSVSKEASNYYLLELKYTMNNDTVIQVDPTSLITQNVITELTYRAGYFGACIQTNNESYICGANSTQLLLSALNFDITNEVDSDLYNFFVETSDIFRTRCLTPYVLLLSIIFSAMLFVACLVADPLHYNAFGTMFALAYITVAFAIIAAVWQDTNTNTALLLFSQILDNFYSVATKQGSYCRGAIWFGVFVQIVVAICCLLLAALDQRKLYEKQNRFWSYI